MGSIEQRVASRYAAKVAVMPVGLGRLIGWALIQSRTLGLPDVHGRPALDYVGKADGLPLDYLGNLAKGFYRDLLKIAKGDEQVVDEALSTWSLHFIVRDGWEKMEGVEFSSARRYVWQSMVNSLLNVLKADRGYAHRFAPEVGEDFEDPRALRRLLDTHPVWDDPGLRAKLEQVHPDAPLYLKLYMAGFSEVEIVGNPRGGWGLIPVMPMLPHVRANPMSPQNWAQHIRPKILRVLAEELG